MNACAKLECFGPGRPFQLSLMFVDKARSLSRVEHVKDASLDFTCKLDLITRNLYITNI